MGDTLQDGMEEEGLYAVERESPRGRTDALCGPPFGRRADGGTLQGVRHLQEDRKQDWGSLPKSRYPMPRGSQPPADPPGQSVAAAGRRDHHPASPRKAQLGSAENPRDPDPTVS